MTSSVSYELADSVATITLDDGKARTELGYEPVIDRATGLDELKAAAQAA